MIIIGITGTLGAGKGTVVSYLVDKFNFHHYSVRGYLTKILTSQGIEPNRDNFTLLANKLRSDNNSPSFLIEELYREAAINKENAIIESIRTTGEIDKLKALGEFYLLAVDGNRKLRYRRVRERNSETDEVSFEKFIEDEDREMNSQDPNSQNIAACIARADYQIMNDGNRAELYHKIDLFLEKMKIKEEE
jgi:dephospho-CoA kinase